MDTTKSTRIAMVKTELTIKEIAKRVGVSESRVFAILRHKNQINCRTLKRLAGAFDMKVSDFIALGE